jgi:hypothetical protein
VTSVQGLLSSEAAKDWNVLFTVTKDSFQVHAVHIPKRHSVIYLTDGLSGKRMDVPEKWQHQSRIELYICFPDYSLPSETDQPSPWLLDYLFRIGEYFTTNEAWLGPGHTFPLKKEHADRTGDYHALILLEPVWLKDELNPYSTNEATTHFLGLAPLFKREFEQKQQKGYGHLYQRLTDAGVSERMDDFRASVFKRKFIFF